MGCKDGTSADADEMQLGMKGNWPEDKRCCRGGFWCENTHGTEALKSCAGMGLVYLYNCARKCMEDTIGRCNARVWGGVVSNSTFLFQYERNQILCSNDCFE